MEEERTDKNGIACLPVLSKEEVFDAPEVDEAEDIDLAPLPRIECCDCCGRPMSALRPFGGPGDPLVGDFTGAFLVKTYRPLWPHNEEEEKAWDEADKVIPIGEDALPWFIARYGEKKGKELYGAGIGYGYADRNWLCRDCIVLELDEYFEKKHKTYLESRDNQTLK